MRRVLPEIHNTNNKPIENISEKFTKKMTSDQIQIEKC